MVALTPPRTSLWRNDGTPWGWLRRTGKGKSPVMSPLAPARRCLVAAAGFSAAINVLALTLPLYSMQVYDRVLSSGSLETLFYLTVIALVALVFVSWLEILRARLLLRVASWVERRFAPECLRRALTMSGGRQGADLTTLRELAVLRQTMGSPVVAALADVPWVPVYLVALFALHPLLGLVAAGGALTLFAIAWAGEILTRRAVAASGEAGTTAQRFVEAAVRSREEIHCMGMSAAVVERWAAGNAAALDQGERACARHATAYSLTRWVRLVVQVAIMAVGTYLVVDHAITGGALFASATLLGRALAPVEQVIGAWRTLAAARAAWRRVAAHLETPAPRRTVRGLPPPRGLLSVEGIAASPIPGARSLLKNVSFAMEPGTVLVVVGSSGAGKTTLARTLVGALPAQAGAVRLDGVDVAGWDRGELGRHVGYLPQDGDLIDSTVRAFIARMEEAPLDRVTEAATIAGVHDMILRLPRGYETRLGSGGFLPSAGQRQRLALARAVFGNPRLVVLDEPDAHLDGPGEAALQKAIAALKARGATVVATSHRPNLLRVADCVLVLRDGAVARFGPRDEVIAALGQPRPAQARDAISSSAA
ncbi:type I secretion system permease/ATPase (plasmid) [Azospirillum baldaniorum]|uniref:Secretion ATP-binding protein (ABC-type transporter family) putative toxin/protease secretion system n=2 Tax=Azospirillum baldaniorum TaxID=1064539 RepID=A0A9P1K1E1_9PROT|nr:type I secretion system permease/ATPase [Azospirillum baldaniorum]CCD03782.1 putative secretion ATP-binding protein (ABC-type transporter family); putative toxin/protease secretion system [Azospirillum baldaniorum]